MLRNRSTSRLPSQERERMVRWFQAAAALLMLHQLASKTARDGYFLKWFGPAHIPEMVAAAAAFALLASYLGSRLFAWKGPAVSLPWLFFASGVLQAGEWGLLRVQPQVASVLVYLHMFGIGAILFSGFWSLLSEEFDPREAKRMLGRITSAGTAGGLAGGIISERMVVWLGEGSLMLLLCTVHVACGFLLLGVGPAETGAKPRKMSPAPNEERPHEAGGRSYLRALATLIALSALATALLDVAFKFSAAGHFGKGPNLFRFLALFYTGVSLLTLLMQSLASSRALEKFGLGKTMAALPGVTAAGSIFSMAFGGFEVFSLSRGAEASIRNSLFKSGYEVCYTPVGAEQKRRVKTLIDVGGERTGDFAGSLIAKLLLQVGATQAIAVSWILGAAALFSTVALVLTRLLDQAYVKALARSLLTRGAELDVHGALDLTTRTVLSRSGYYRSAGEGTGDVAAAEAPPQLTGDAVLAVCARLRSEDSAVVYAALASAEPSDPLVAAQIVQLLGSRQAGSVAAARLEPVASRWVGLLCDCLTASAQDFEIRRKIPGLLSGVADQRAVDGLLRGVEDERLEVRIQCGRALLKLRRAHPELLIAREVVLRAVERELSAGKLVGEGQRLAESETETFGVEGLDAFLKERSNVGLQHVFTLLALVFPEEPLLVSYRALSLDDRRLRATALEYLESVLPQRTRELLWSVVGEHPRLETQRQAQEVLEDLMKASATVVIRLKQSERP